MLRFIESKAHTQKPSPEARPFYSPRMRKGRQVVKFKLTYTHAHSSSHGSKPMGTIRKLEDLSDYCEIFFVQSSRRQNTSWSIQKCLDNIQGLLECWLLNRRWWQDWHQWLDYKKQIRQTRALTKYYAPPSPSRLKINSPEDRLLYSPKYKMYISTPKPQSERMNFKKHDLLHQMLVKIELTWTHVRV